MPDGEYGVRPEHARSGIAHDRLNAAAHCRAETMNRALAAHRLIDPEPAFPDPINCVGTQFPALSAQSVADPVMRSAKYPDHYFNSLAFSIHAAVCRSYFPRIQAC